MRYCNGTKKKPLIEDSSTNKFFVIIILLLGTALSVSANPDYSKTVPSEVGEGYGSSYQGDLAVITSLSIDPVPVKIQDMGGNNIDISNIDGLSGNNPVGDIGDWDNDGHLEAFYVDYSDDSGINEGSLNYIDLSTKKVTEIRSDSIGDVGGMADIDSDGLQEITYNYASFDPVLRATDKQGSTQELQTTSSNPHDFADWDDDGNLEYVLINNGFIYNPININPANTPQEPIGFADWDRDGDFEYFYKSGGSGDNVEVYDREDGAEVVTTVGNRFRPGVPPADWDKDGYYEVGKVTDNNNAKVYDINGEETVLNWLSATDIGGVTATIDPTPTKQIIPSQEKARSPFFIQSGDSNPASYTGRTTTGFNLDFTAGVNATQGRGNYSAFFIANSTNPNLGEQTSSTTTIEIDSKGLIPNQETTGYPFYIKSGTTNPLEYSGSLTPADTPSFQAEVYAAGAPGNYTTFFYANSTNPNIEYQLSDKHTVEIVLPIVEILPPADINQNNATLNASVSNYDLFDPGTWEYRYEYREVGQSSFQQTPIRSISPSTTDFTEEITALDRGTDYEYRAVLIRNSTRERVSTTDLQTFETESRDYSESVFENVNSQSNIETQKTIRERTLSITTIQNVVDRTTTTNRTAFNNLNSASDIAASQIIERQLLQPTELTTIAEEFQIFDEEAGQQFNILDAEDREVILGSEFNQDTQLTSSIRTTINIIRRPVNALQVTHIGDRAIVLARSSAQIADITDLSDSEQQVDSDNTQSMNIIENAGRAVDYVQTIIEGSIEKVITVLTDGEWKRGSTEGTTINKGKVTINASDR